MLTAAHEGKLTYNDVTRLCAENVARLYGLYPRKGAGPPAVAITARPQPRFHVPGARPAMSITRHSH